MTRTLHVLTQINPIKRKAICSVCGEVKILSREKGRFRCATSYYGFMLKSKIRKKRLQAENYFRFKDIPQPEKCELCGLKTKELYGDHDHKTGKTRGWLCSACNLGIGSFKDNKNLLKKAILYLT